MNAIIQYQLDFDGAFHIGAGLGSAAVKRMALARGGQFSITGATLKGCIREACRDYLVSSGTAEPEVALQRVFARPGDPGRGLDVCAFSDLEIAGGASLSSKVRHGVQISRALRVAQPHALYSTQIVIPEGSGSGRILFASSEANDHDLGLLLTGMLLLRRIGGSKTSGLGRCRIPPDRISVSRGGVHPDANGVGALVEAFLEVQA